MALSFVISCAALASPQDQCILDKHLDLLPYYESAITKMAVSIVADYNRLHPDLPVNVTNYKIVREKGSNELGKITDIQLTTDKGFVARIARYWSFRDQNYFLDGKWFELQYAPKFDAYGNFESCGYRIKIDGTDDSWNQYGTKMVLVNVETNQIIGGHFVNYYDLEHTTQEETFKPFVSSRTQ